MPNMDGKHQARVLLRPAAVCTAALWYGPHKSRGFTVAQNLWHSASGLLKQRQDFVVLQERRARRPYVVIISLQQK